MYKKIILLICCGMIISMDKDWASYGDHEVSLNTIIIKLNNDFAPKLGLEAPITLEQVFGLKDLDQNSNFKNFVPLFRHYASFSELHHTHELHSYYKLSFNNPESNLLNLISAIKNLSMVEDVEFNYKMKAFLVPNDSYYQDQWTLNWIFHLLGV